jgi:hypothetical protein
MAAETSPEDAPGKARPATYGSSAIGKPNVKLNPMSARMGDAKKTSQPESPAKNQILTGIPRI